MNQQSLPRVHELIALIEDRSDPAAYFHNFDDSIKAEPSKAKVWFAREQEFQRLDTESWRYLKNEARPYLTSKQNSRGWEQLISILNQARAYNHLFDIGCQDIRFIPRAVIEGIKTPDLVGTLNGRRVVCEVKTINVSDIETDRRNSGGVGASSDVLEPGFFKKLKSDLNQAKRQLDAHDNSDGCMHIAFVVPNFDDFLAEYKANYFQQIDEYLGRETAPCLEVVFFNQITTFHVKVALKNASVINELG
ncbi:hypothetical protein [Methylomonas koyamae]|uniref:hypothetical protein n=1 Tax=Methylomonas koyamae TaxID=702114 RepID=UPI002872FA87|nr:hypothetical protein [Methylomonas koyamae]WNB76446.1 hypothetical protein RI210_02400 [Methylomonas koyamae]